MQLAPILRFDYAPRTFRCLLTMRHLFALPVLAGLVGCATPALNQRFPPIGEFVEVQGQRLHLVDAGPVRDTQQPALILIHGANSNLRDFESSIAPVLRETLRVISVDRPGFGHSPRAGGDWQNPSVLADLILAAAEQRGVEKPVVLGHSWAGAIAMAALVDHADRITGAVALSGAVGHWSGAADFTHRLAGWPLIGPTFAHTLLWPVGSLILPAAIGGVLAPNPVPEGYVDNIGAPLALRGSTFLANGQDMRELSEWLQNYSPRYRDIRAPLLLMHGSADELVPWWNHGQRVLPVVGHAEHMLLEGVGHSPHHAATDRVATLLRDWIATLR